MGTNTLFYQPQPQADSTICFVATAKIEALDRKKYKKVFDVFIVLKLKDDLA